MGLGVIMSVQKGLPNIHCFSFLGDHFLLIEGQLITEQVNGDCIPPNN